MLVGGAVVGSAVVGGAVVGEAVGSPSPPFDPPSCTSDPVQHASLQAEDFSPEEPQAHPLVALVAPFVGCTVALPLALEPAWHRLVETLILVSTVHYLINQ